MGGLTSGEDSHFNDFVRSSPSLTRILSSDKVRSDYPFVKKKTFGGVPVRVVNALGIESVVISRLGIDHGFAWSRDDLHKEVNVIIVPWQ